MDGENEFERLFDAAKNKNWEKVVAEYKENPSACVTKLTQSEQTALHIAITWYDTQSDNDLDDIKKILDAIPKEKAFDVLSLKDANGNTPLHLAATLGSVCLCEEITLGRGGLICLRNNESETPLFLAAHHGKMDAFFCLRKIYKKMLGPDGKGQAREGDKQQEEQLEADIESFCRGRDGKTVLHSAISGEYYMDGESPLHVLARKPNSFKSSSHLRFYDYIIYQCVYVPKLKVENFDDYTRESRSGGLKTPNFSYPGNYETCVGLYELVHKVIGKVFAYISKGCRRSSRSDEENPENNQKKPLHSGRSEGNPKISIYPPIYETCINFFSYLIMLLLFIFRFGNTKIKRIQQKKERHTWATQIVKMILKIEKSYHYYSNGKVPKSYRSGTFALPGGPPQEGDDEIEEVDNGSGAKKKQSEDSEEIDGGELGGNPFLIAAKMGITEIVREILKQTDMAFDDLDEKGKNVLLLAIEHRQSKVLDLLLKRKIPDFVFQQVDNEGNGPHHLAAMYRQNFTWRLPGAALQMHGEVTWFKHVKKSLPPLRFPHRNEKGLTPKKIFRETHTKLAEDGTAWLIKTAESSSVIAALIATVAFATSLTVPGGVGNDGYPVHRNQPAFVVFTISSLIALWFSLSALVFFLAIITSRCEVRDFAKDLPGRLLLGLSSLFTSIAAMLVSFCASQFFLLKRNLEDAALPIYVVASVPPVIFAFAQLPLYVDLMHVFLARVPTRSNKMFYR